MKKSINIFQLSGRGKKTKYQNRKKKFINKNSWKYQPLFKNETIFYGHIILNISVCVVYLKNMHPGFKIKN